MNYPTPGTIVNHMPSRLVEAQSARSGADQEEEFRIAILIPCFNEELTIGGVVEAFRRQLSQAAIYVNDNNSTDRTGRGCIRGRGNLPPRAKPGQGQRGAAHVR